MSRYYAPVLTTFFVLLLTACAATTYTQKTYAREIYPGQTWLKYSQPEQAGFSSKKLAHAENFANQIGSAAVMVIYKGAVLADWGDIEKRYMCHSVRKSLLSALYGIYVEKGDVDLQKTMAQLSIDDKPPLTETEKKSRIIDLLKARSGVYHAAAYETASMKKRRPERGSHEPGTFYYYNNWDFNVLGYIFNKLTGSCIFEKFKSCFAEPLQMQDYRVRDGYYHLEKHHSIYPAYPFRLSARDMARFGLLFLRNGKWKGKQILTEDWIKKSTAQYSISTRSKNSGYGYLWWIVKVEPFKSLGAYAARGYGGHSIMVVPGADMVFVHRVNTWWDLDFSSCIKQQGDEVGKSQRLKLFKMILDAKISEPKPRPELVTIAEKPKRTDIIKLDEKAMNKYLGKYEFANNYIAQIRKLNGKLIIEGPATGKFTLFPLSETDFIMEDVDVPVLFKFDNEGIPLFVSIGFEPEEKCYGRLVSEKGSLQRKLESLTGEFDSLVPQLMADMNVPGVSISIIQDGKISGHRCYGVKRAGEPEKVTPETVFEACSMSKLPFSYVVLKLAEQGKIDLDKPLVEYLDRPYLQDEPLHKLITARMVMLHTTGFPNWRKGGWRKGGPITVKFKPGTNYGYSGEGFLYLQRVIEHITGKPLNSLMKEILLDPIEMTSSSYVWQERYDNLASAGHDKAGKVKPNRRLYRKDNSAFTMYCTPDDYARFIIEVMKDGRSAEHSLSKDSIEEMLTSAVKLDEPASSRPIRLYDDVKCKSFHRGLGWAIGKTDFGIRCWHGGSNSTGFRCYSEFNPQEHTGIVIMTGSVNGKQLWTKLILLIDFP